MKAMKCFSLGALGAWALTTTVVAADAPPVPETPSAVRDIIYARPFTLDKSEGHGWRMEKPMVSSGYVLVLEVDPDLVYPRQQAEPVLYVGRQTAERINHGHESGRVVAIVPGQIDPQREDYLDLSKVRIWFGTPELPERVDAAMIERERRLAVRAGIRPLPAAKVSVALEEGGPTRAFTDKRELMRALAPLVREYSPQEPEVADGLDGGGLLVPNG
ncbi:MAG: hypothetical protein ACYS0D_04515 [Planctomycetota bacterium]|jgi:hypothetical protein